MAPDEYDARLDAADLPDTTVKSGVSEHYWRGFADALDISAAEASAMQAELWDAYCGEENVTASRALGIHAIEHRKNATTIEVIEEFLASSHIS